MATVTTKLMTNKKPDRSGKYQLAIRVYHKKIFYFFFGFRLLEDDWNDTAKCVRSSHHKNAILNEIIKKRHKEIDDIVEIKTALNKGISAKRLKRIIEREISEQNNDFLAYYDDYIKNLIAEDQVSYGKSHRCSYNILEKYTGGQLPFKEMNVQFLKQLRTFFLSEKEYAKNTVYNYFGNYRTAYNSAVKEGVIPQENNPFFMISISPQTVRKTHLSFSQVQALRNVETKPGSMEWKAQKAFLLSFWAAGMRISDICLMRWSNIKKWSREIPELDYTMKKNGKQIVIDILPPAKRILQELKPEIMDIDMIDKRVFGLVDDRNLTEEEKFLQIKIGTTQINRSLKAIAERAGINEKVTFHVARHSFAGCFEELDMPVAILQSLLAHSSLTTTENYRDSFGNKKANKALNQFFERFKEASNG